MAVMRTSEVGASTLTVLKFNVPSFYTLMMLLYQAKNIHTIQKKIEALLNTEKNKYFTSCQQNAE